MAKTASVFWDYPNDSSVKPGSCIFYFGDGEWGSCIPHYMIATQPKKKLNVERVQYYKLNPNCRAIAYYMDGNITALLDGHHKAMAAAMEHRPCNSIVISKCTYFMRTMQNGEKYGCLEANEAIFKVDELQSEFCKYKYLSEKKEHKYVKPHFIPDDFCKLFQSKSPVIKCGNDNDSKLFQS